MYLSHLVWLGYEHRIRPTVQAGGSVSLTLVLENLLCPSEQKGKQLIWGGLWVVTAGENEAFPLRDIQSPLS